MNPCDIWEILKSDLEIPDIALKSFHVNKFRNLRINAVDGDIPMYTARFEEAWRRMLDSGEEIPEKHQCLPENYGYFKRELDGLPETDFKFKEVKEEVLRVFKEGLER